MNPLSARAADAVAQTEHAREDHTRTDARSTHQAVLYRGEKTFTHAHQAHAKLLSNKLRANKLRARLAQARKTRTTRRARFSAPRKTQPKMLKHAGAHASLLRSHLHRAGGLRVSRDGGRGGGQQGQQQQGQGGGQQGQQQRRERSWRRSSTQSVSSAHSAAVFDHTTREIADACCDALLSLRRQLATNPHARIDASLMRLARDATAARFAQHALEGGSFEAIKAQLIERAEKHAPSSPRMASFNLLAGLHLLMMERPLRRSNASRMDSTLSALELASHA
jgi:type III secretion regulatory protein HpaA